MRKWYSGLLRLSFLNYSLVLIAIVIAFVSVPMDIDAQRVVVLIVSGLVVFTTPSFLFVYLVFTRKDNSSIQTMLVDVLFNVATLIFFVLLVTGIGPSILLIQGLIICPFPSIGIRLAYFLGSRGFKKNR